MLWQLWNSCFPIAVRPETGRKPTARHASPESLIFSALLSHGATAACVLDRAGRCLQLSPNFGAVTGIEPGQCFQHGLFQHFPDADREALEKACADADRLPQTQSFLALMEEDECGTKALEWRLLPAEPGAEQIIMLVEDASAQWHAAQIQQQAETRVAIAEKGRSDFLANMSHELRTPLNAVLGFAQMMEAQIFGKIQNPTYRDYVRKIQESGHDLLHKINDLLHVSSLDAGNPTQSDVAPMGAPVPLNALLREVIESFTHQAFRRDITIRPILLDPGPVAMVERLELYGAVAQLLSNAVKHAKPGSTIQLLCRARDKGVSLHVLDRGPGINGSLIQQINASLKRPLVERGRTDIGLGLAIAAEYMRRHGGTIQIKSRPEGGTEAQLTLPRQRIRWDKVAPQKTRRDSAIAG